MSDLKITLAAARVNARLTQAEVARNLKVSNKTINNWENGKTEPTYATLCMLASMYQVPIDAILLPKTAT